MRKVNIMPTDETTHLAADPETAPQTTPRPRAQHTRHRVAVVCAHNEETTVAGVLERLRHLVDEIVVVDDGSTDLTRSTVEEWLPRAPRAGILSTGRHLGTSAGFRMAFSALRQRMDAGELSPDDLVVTVDGSGQHDLDVLESLRRRAVEERLDALLVCRDLTIYPFYKQLGNTLLSAWASLWSGGVRLHDVESGYRVFRLGALARALDESPGRFPLSENVETAIILSRLGYRVRNNILVPVPHYRSRTRLADAVADLVAIPLAAHRAATGSPRHGGGWAALALPVTVTATVGTLALLALRGLWSLLARRAPTTDSGQPAH